MKLRLLPHPILTPVLALIWLLLVNSLSPGQILLGLILGWAIPVFTLRFWPERVRIHKPLTLMRFFAVVMYDILIANLDGRRADPGRTQARQAGLRPRAARLAHRSRDQPARQYRLFDAGYRLGLAQPGSQPSGRAWAEGQRPRRPDRRDQAPLRGADQRGLRTMLNIAVSIAFALVSGALFLSLWRLLRGPDKPDRILALDTLYINTIALLVLLGIHLSSSLVFRGRAPDRHDGVCRDRGTLQISVARRYHRVMKARLLVDFCHVRGFGKRRGHLFALELTRFHDV